MSRSIKYPIFRQKASKGAKRLANKKVRHYITLLDSGFKSTGFFHKLFEQWDIRDWKYIPYTKEDIIKAKRK